MRKSPFPFVSPFGFAVLFRSGRSGKWNELGRAPTMLAALNFVDGKAQFWIHTLTAEPAAGEIITGAITNVALTSGEIITSAITNVARIHLGS